jgi:sulfatase maturation enzyme AslB (radical SAM superfamily)
LHGWAQQHLRGVKTEHSRNIYSIIDHESNGHRFIIYPEGDITPCNVNSLRNTVGMANVLEQNHQITCDRASQVYISKALTTNLTYMDDPQGLKAVQYM